MATIPLTVRLADLPDGPKEAIRAENDVLLAYAYYRFSRYYLSPMHSPILL